jgi:RES domain-containing protein
VYSIERLKAILNTAPLVTYSGYSYRVIEDRWRNDPLSAIGALQSGGRYNAPGAFSLLYTANSRVTALKEVQALFDTPDGQLADVPRNPELILTLEITLRRILDLTDAALCAALGTSREELISEIPSRFIINAQGKTTATQNLGAACHLSQRISALKVPSAAHSVGYCLNIYPDRLVAGEYVAIRDEHNRLKAEIEGRNPPTTTT